MLTGSLVFLPSNFSPTLSQCSLPRSKSAIMGGRRLGQHFMSITNISHGFFLSFLWGGVTCAVLPLAQFDYTPKDTFNGG